MILTIGKLILGIIIILPIINSIFYRIRYKTSPIYGGTENDVYRFMSFIGDLGVAIIIIIFTAIIIDYYWNIPIN